MRETTTQDPRPCRSPGCQEPRATYPRSANTNGLCRLHQSERIRAIKSRIVVDPDTGRETTANSLSSTRSRLRKLQRAVEETRS